MNRNAITEGEKILKEEEAIDRTLDKVSKESSTSKHKK